MRHFYFFIYLLISVSLLGQNTVELVSQKGQSTTIKFNLNDFKFVPVHTPNGQEVIITAKHLTQIMEKGAPDMPKFAASVIIPDTKKMDIKIIDTQYIEYHNINIAPSKGNLTRDINPSDVAYTYGKVYNKNSFYPTKIAGIGEPYILRDFRGTVVYAYPFVYNPQTKTLRVYKKITVKVYPTGEDKINVLRRKKEPKKLASEFAHIYKKQFINYEQIIDKYTPLEEEGNMLIIADDQFVDQMQDFVLWKNTIGRPTEIVPISQIGSTATEIKNYVVNYYNEHGLTYLLLVGDAEQIPTNTGSNLGGPSDNAYGYILGNDHYQELFVGRFSAQNSSQLATMISRTIEYEKGEQLPTNVYNKPLAIASDQGPGDDDEYDYQHARNMLADLLNYTYQSPPYELYDGSQGGEDENGDPTPSDVAEVLNTGVGIITYTGHGSETSWGTSGFSVSDVQSLNNGNKLPFVWSVACVVGSFVNNNECFAESWLRHTDANGNPIGAIGFFGSTINQSWAPPMVAQDEMVDILVESYQNNIKRTFAGLSINGCFLMNDETGDYNMTDTWTIFGDPSVTVRTDNPSEMIISHEDVIVYGNPNFTISCDYNGALATISKNGQIIGSAKVENNTASIELDQNLFSPGDLLTLAVFGYNKITYLTELNVITPNGPYITMDNYSINDTNYLVYNTDQNLKITLKNVGTENALSVIATLSTTDPHITLNNNSNISVGNIPTGNNTVFNVDVSVSGDLPDNYMVPFHLSITDANNNTWEKDFSIPVYSPILENSFVQINDGNGELNFVSIPVVSIPEGDQYEYNIEVEQTGGNGNHSLDPNESSIMILRIENKGHAYARNISVNVNNDNPNVNIENANLTIDYLDAGQSVDIPIKITVNDQANIGELSNFTIYSQCDNSSSYSDTFSVNLPIGLIIEDFESGNFDSYNWNNSGNYPWEITTTDPYQGTYCAGVPETLSDNQTSTLSITVNNVYQGAKISFYYKVSSEENYDFFKFLVNNQEELSMSGTVDWTYYEYIFNQPGNYTLTWEYSKDGSISNGEDKAWIDTIVFPVLPSKKSIKNKSISITAVDIPDWLSLNDNGDGTATMQGIAPNKVSSYNVSLRATNGNISSDQNFTINVFNLANVKSNEMLHIYPNPTTNFIYIETTSNMHIKLTNLQGKIIKEIDTKGNAVLNVSNLVSGIYILDITSQSKHYCKRIIKQ